ncbi:hypothetical protein [Pseudarthrobacter sp. WHRI 8279]|uniref:hypothetical protein n=1 Tax=Pseudarthrobacter sp. WHRI 8279 TaxID=3162566 RepID=UPI0032EB878A
MSESDGIDDILDNGIRQSLMVASRIAETLARRRQEAQRQQEHQDIQVAHEARARVAAERTAAHAALAPVHNDQWWDKAQPADIATAHAVAEGWKDQDPTALHASEKIRQEVLARYGIDTHDVGPDTISLETRIQATSTGPRNQGNDDHQGQLAQATAWAAKHQPEFFADWQRRKNFTDTVDAERSAESELIRHWQTATGEAARPANADQVPAQAQDDHQVQLAQARAWAAEHDPDFFDDWKRRHGFADSVADEHRDERNLIQRWHNAVAQEDTRKAAIEHEKAMQLLAAARAEELRTQAKTLAPEMERHHVPEEYLANHELAKALQKAHNAKTPAAVTAADAEIQERMFLIGKDGINGPDIDQLRHETTANVNGVRDAHFKDPAFVQAAKEMHEARLLAEGGFKGTTFSAPEQRYEQAEKELFTRLEGLGRDIENRVTGNNNRLKDQGLKAETAPEAGYGSAEHHEKFADSLENTGANETQIRGRLAAARSEGTHPSSAVTPGKGATKARKSRRGATVGAERGKNGLSR